MMKHFSHPYLAFVEGEEGGEGGGSGSRTYSEDYVKALRQEAAGYRTQLRAAERERDEAKSAAEAATAAARAAESKSGNTDALVASANARALQYEVALEKGLSPTLAARLQGSTRDELVADADALVALAGPKGTAQFDQGNTPPPPTAPNVNDALRVLSGVSAS